MRQENYYSVQNLILVKNFYINDKNPMKLFGNPNISLCGWFEINYGRRENEYKKKRKISYDSHKCVEKRTIMKEDRVFHPII